MTIKQSITGQNLHWNYFLALENDMERLARYVEFNESNYATYSIELAHLLFAAASEYEVVAKSLCRKLDPEKKSKQSFGKVIANHFPEIVKENVFVYKYGLTLDTPLEKIIRGPDWWVGYNNVKHSRDLNFPEANLRNALLALAGLFIAILYHKIAELDDATKYIKGLAVEQLEPKATLLRFQPNYYVKHKI